MLALALLITASWLLVTKAVKEQRAFLAISLTAGLFWLVLLSAANLSLDSRWLGLGSLIVAGYLGVKLPRSQIEWPTFSRPVATSLFFFTSVIFAYTSLSMNTFPDDDYWIHFPLQAMLRDHGLPVLHPFFTDIKMNGHYGKDLLIATVSKYLDISLLHSLYIQTMSIQLCSALSLIGLSRLSSRSELSVVLVLGFVFFGINVGGRGGLLDCYQNNNSLAYFITLCLFHMLLLVYEQSSPQRVFLTAFCLGTFALIYETHFGLVGLVLGLALFVTRRKEFAIIGIVALALACIQGGPITKLVSDKLQPTEKQWTPGELNQHQIIKLKFPKDELFQIRLAYGAYQRRSVVYDLLPNLGPVSSIKPGTPYRPIWSWDVLKIHWFVTLIAPLSLWLLVKRKSGLGCMVWSFAAFAYLTPSLVHFGPIYEFEYFRWQFAAGFGFAIAAGLALGDAISQFNKTFRGIALGVLVTITILPTFFAFVPAAFSNDPTLIDCILPRSEAKWILSRKARLGGFGYEDLLAAHRLRQDSSPGERLLVNSPNSRGQDIRYGSTLSAISRLRLSGHSLPWPSEPVGTPPFHRSAPASVFWDEPSVAILDQLGVQWIFLRPGKENSGPLKRWLANHSQPIWNHGDNAIFRFQANDSYRPMSVLNTISEHLSPLEVSGLQTKYLTRETIRFSVAGDPEKRYAWGFVAEGQSFDSLDLLEVVCWSDGPALTVAPPSPGDFDLCLFEVRDQTLHPIGTRFPIRVEERDRQSQPVDLGA